MYKLSAGPIESSVEEACTNRIGGIDDDGVKVVLLLLHIQRSVHEQLQETSEHAAYEFNTRILEGDSRAVYQILLCDVDHLAVNFAHYDVLHFGVLRDFTQNATIATADNENLRVHEVKCRYCLGMSVGKERQVGDHFLVGELVSLRDLDHSIKHEHSPIALRIEYKNVLSMTRFCCPNLILRLLVVEDFLHLQTETLTYLLTVPSGPNHSTSFPSRRTSLPRCSF